MNESKVKERAELREKYDYRAHLEQRRRKCCASCSTITGYMCSESVKKPTAFKIGVFTVFIVVMCITMLKSVVDSSPILFVKIGQSEVGAIDVTMRVGNPTLALQPGNINYYNVDPNLGLFGDNFANKAAE